MAGPRGQGGSSGLGSAAPAVALEKLTSREILADLATMDLRPWLEISNHEAHNGARLASLLKPFQIAPTMTPTATRKSTSARPSPKRGTVVFPLPNVRTAGNPVMARFSAICERPEGVEASGRLSSPRFQHPRGFPVDRMFDPPRIEVPAVNDVRVLLVTLSCRTSSKGRPYLAGYFGRCRVVALQASPTATAMRGAVLKPDGTVYVNDEANWTWLQQSASKAARWLGYVRFDASSTSAIPRRSSSACGIVHARAADQWREPIWSIDSDRR